MTRVRWSVLAVAALLAGCALRPPKIVAVPLRADAPIDVPAGAVAAANWPVAQWWTRYDDPILNQLVEAAVSDAPMLNTANARFASARQSVRVTGAAVGVRVEASGSVQRQRLSDNGLFPPEFLGFHWYNQSDLGISAEYTFDWWGKQRASLEAAVDEARASQAERNEAALLLSAAVADGYFGWQADQQRLAIARERLVTLERRASVTRRRIAAELDSGDNSRLVTQDIAATRELLAELEGSARLRLVALASLLGRSVDELPALQAQALPDLPSSLPPNLRLDLIARRPDIAASRWRVEAARRNLVAARAEYFPDISVHALAALSSVDIGRLLESGSASPAFGAAIHLPLFDAGRNAARFGARQAQIDAAIATYDEAVVGAAREVASAATTGLAIGAQRTQRRIRLAESRALEAAAAARVRAGTTDIRPQLLASLAADVERDALAQLDLAAVSADISLQRALGGGYLFQEQTP